MAGDKSDSTRDSNHGVFLGNKHLRSKSGLEGVTDWRLKHPATRYKKTTLQRNLRCFLHMTAKDLQNLYASRPHILSRLGISNKFALLSASAYICHISH